MPTQPETAAHRSMVYPDQKIAELIAENARLRRVMAQAVSLIDRAMGDTDPSDPDHPLLNACQILSAEGRNQ